MFYPALWGSKLYYKLFVNHRASDRMGMVASYLDRNFLAHIARPPLVIGITGTNGKTTTTNFIDQLFRAMGYKVSCNRGGANLRPGISKALMMNTTIFNHTDSEVGIIEFDENTAEQLITPLKADYVVITNLFTDMVSYSGNVDNSYAHLEAALSPETTLILNADDLISCQLGGPNNKKVYFSMAQLEGEPTHTESLVNDVRVCPKCNHKLEYSFQRYHHIGKATCPNCGFTNPEPDYVLTAVDEQAGTVTINGVDYPLIDRATHNLYNELALVALASEMGLENIGEAVAQVKVPEIRFYDDHIGGKHLISQLAKGENPIAISRTLDAIVSLPGTKEIIIVLDDEEIAKDNTISEMISYIYATDFEPLADPSVTKIVIAGQRRHDYHARLLIGGVDCSKVTFVEDEMETWKYLDYEADNIVLFHGMGIQFSIKAVYEKMKEELERRAEA